ncbi:MAG: leucine-rich repeat protein [Clostridia bacterium]|nr:leucine-rich repeat protein [Clostridia bacterium]
MKKSLACVLAFLLLIMLTLPVAFTEGNAPNDVYEIAELSVVPAPDARFEEMATLVNDQTVNIRSGPGTKYAQIGEAYPGASFYCTGITKSGFLEIVYPDINLIRVLAYVNKDLAEVSRIGAEDVVYSSVAGYLRVKPKTQVYFDASLNKKTKQTLGDGEDVPFAGVSSSGSYAVLYTTVNKKEERLLWVGYISPKDVVEVSAPGEQEVITKDDLAFMAVGVAEEERMDADGQWKYVLEEGGATITGYVGEPPEELVFPSELDGYAVTCIGRWVSKDCDITSVTIPDGVTQISAHAFEWYCPGLSSVTIPDSVTSIGASAFYYCKLTGITIPVGVMDIGRNPFEGCPLTHIDVAVDNPVYEQVDGVLFDKQRKMLVAYPHVREENPYIIPDGVLSIGEAAFSNNSRLTGVIIPDSGTHIGDMAFWACTGLTDVTIPDGMTSIGIKAFGECDNLTSVSIPASVTSIGEEAFGWGSDITLIVEKGSYAEKYAKENNIDISPSSYDDGDGEADGETDGETISIGVGALSVGDRLTFGSYQGEAIEWRVLAVGENGRALVIADRILDAKPYNARDYSVTWETCTLRQWLNDDFYSAAFSEQEQSRIVEVELVNNDNPFWGTPGGNATRDKIFLLSLAEARYFFRNDEDRIAMVTEYARYASANIVWFYRHSETGERIGLWWLRSPSIRNTHAVYADYRGNVLNTSNKPVNETAGVRPALLLKP